MTEASNTGPYFADIIGQRDVQNDLLRAASQNHVPHAMHFLGPEGSGNLALALAFANYVLCQEPGEKDACGRCAACIKMKGFQHPDLHFVFPVVNPKKNKSVQSFMAEWRGALQQNSLMTMNEWMQIIADENKMGVISKDIALEIQQKISMKSFEGGFRIALIWMPEYFNASAANKLLKILEEPPAKTLFLLVGNSTDSLLPTILSRVQTVYVPKVDSAEIEQTLIDREGVEPGKARSAAFLSDGNLSLALRLARDEDSSLQFFQLFRDWFRACYQPKEGVQRVALSDQFSDLKREGQKSFLTYSLQMLRQCAVVMAGAEELLMLEGEARDLVLKLGKLFNAEQMQKMTRAIDETAYHIERNGSAKILFIDLSVQIKNLFQNG